MKDEELEEIERDEEEIRRMDETAAFGIESGWYKDEGETVGNAQYQAYRNGTDYYPDGATNEKTRRR